MSTNLKKCRLCSSNELELVLDLGNQPLANSLLKSANIKEEFYPLKICRCASCKTIQLTETVEPAILFKDYIWVTGTSKVALDYSKIFCDRILKKCTQGQKNVVEIASNDGTFLKPFSKKGHNVLGIDPAENIAKIANSNNIPTKASFFSNQLAKEIILSKGEADIVFARNVIPHVAEANDVVRGISTLLNKSKGIGGIEFHRADLIFRELHYDSIYHEHLFYHSLDSINYLLKLHGLNIFDIDVSPISGGSYVVYFRHSKSDQSPLLKNAMNNELEIGIDKLNSWRDFSSRTYKHRIKLKEIINQFSAEGKTIAGYGASARSSTLLNYCEFNNKDINYIVDKSPMKHYLFSPGSKIPIVPPEKLAENPPDVIFLLAWNFKDEILKELSIKYKWKGKVIIPFPIEPITVEI